MNGPCRCRMWVEMDCPVIPQLVSIYWSNGGTDNCSPATASFKVEFSGNKEIPMLFLITSNQLQFFVKGLLDEMSRNIEKPYI